MLTNIDLLNLDPLVFTVFFCPFAFPDSLVYEAFNHIGLSESFSFG